MSVVHSLALDEGTNKLYVADRENHRVLVFGGNSGKLLSEIKFKDPVYAVAYNPANGKFGNIYEVHSFMHRQMNKQKIILFCRRSSTCLNRNQLPTSGDSFGNNILFKNKKSNWRVEAETGKILICLVIAYFLIPF